MLDFIIDLFTDIADALLDFWLQKRKKNGKRKNSIFPKTEKSGKNKGT